MTDNPEKLLEYEPTAEEEAFLNAFTLSEQDDGFPELVIAVDYSDEVNSLITKYLPDLQDLRSISVYNWDGDWFPLPLKMVNPAFQAFGSALRRYREKLREKSNDDQETRELLHDIRLLLVAEIKASQRVLDRITRKYAVSLALEKWAEDAADG